MGPRCSWLVGGGGSLDGVPKPVTRETPPKPIESQVDDRRGVESQQLAEEKSTDDGDAERVTELRTGAGGECQWQAAEERGHGGHHDGAKAQQASLVDRLLGRLPFLALRFKREVDHHDGVFLNDTN